MARRLGTIPPGSGLARPLVGVWLVLLASCSSSEPPATTAAPRGGDTPQQAVEVLVDAIRQRRFDDTVGVTVAEQMPFIVVVEGGTIAEALAADPDQVASNFWRSFAQALGPEALAGLAVEPSGTRPFQVRETEFAKVVVKVGGTARTLVVRETDEGWQVDVVASFAEVLGGRYGAAADQILESPQAAGLVPDLRDQAVSLEAVLSLPGIGGQVGQAMLAVVTRLQE